MSAIDCLDLLCEEGAERPRLMSVAIHDRLTGRPVMAAGLIKFLKHARNYDKVWFGAGRHVAEHWRRGRPPAAP